MRGRPKYTVLDISRVEDVKVDKDLVKEDNKGFLGIEEEVRKEGVGANDGVGLERTDDETEKKREEGVMEIKGDDKIGSEDVEIDENNWEEEEEEREVRKRDKEAEYHLFVKTHQKRRHRGTRHRARSSS